MLPAFLKNRQKTRNSCKGCRWPAKQYHQRSCECNSLWKPSQKTMPVLAIAAALQHSLVDINNPPDDDKWGEPGRSNEGTNEQELGNCERLTQMKNHKWVGVKEERGWTNHKSLWIYDREYEQDGDGRYGFNCTCEEGKSEQDKRRRRRELHSWGFELQEDETGMIRKM